MMHPRIEVNGRPRERGRQYGSAAAEQVHRSVEAYGEAFEHYAGWHWDRVRAEAERFAPAIEGYGRPYLEEIEGIADGAGLDAIDILAINVRTEVMFAATARDAEARRRLPAECSAFAALGARTGDGRTLVGQNWDWLPHTQETTIILEARQDSGPNFVTVVEAGLLAKFGLNSSGVGLVTNALVTARDLGGPGVPYHVLLRAILDAETLSDALVALQRAERAASANYLIAHEDGVALDVEAEAGDFAQLYLGYPEDGVLLHTNHFINGLRGRDFSVYAMPDSPVRLARLRQLLAERAGGPLDVAFWQQTLADHATFPLGVCCHPDPRLPVPERSLTVAAGVMDPARRTLWLASGTPCSEPFDELDYSSLLAKPSALRDAARSAP